MSLVSARFMIVLRWIMVAPLAIAAGAATQWVLVLANYWALYQFFNPDNFIGWGLITLSSNLCSAAALVYIAAYVVPTGRKAVSIVAATLVCFMAVKLTAEAGAAGDYRAMVPFICHFVGACGSSASIVLGETSLPTDLLWSANNADTAQVEDGWKDDDDFGDEADAVRANSSSYLT